jgi:hypothetical protein
VVSAVEKTSGNLLAWVDEIIRKKKADGEILLRPTDDLALLPQPVSFLFLFGVISQKRPNSKEVRERGS